MRPMLPRACLVLLVLGASGCLHNARLATAREAVETFNAPVKCGPMGFRRVPLQARFGEYVRLTVSAPVALSGSVMVHANGLAHPARVWTSTSGEGLVVEARFENTDPDLPSALRATQPIDVTIADLTAPEGGSCEGAVFTLEHGRLVPPTTDALWLAELERRGGAELAARREARRRMSEEELARENQNSQPEFSTVLAGWNEPQQETLATAAVETDTATATEADAWALPAGAQTNGAVAVAQVNVGATDAAATNAPIGVAQTSVDGSVAVAQVNAGPTGAAATNDTLGAQTSVEGSVAVAQVNLGATSAAATNDTLGAQTSVEGPVAVAQVNVGPTGAATTNGTVGAQTSVNGSVAVAQVNVGAASVSEFSQTNVGATGAAATNGPLGAQTSVEGSVAVAQVNVAADFAQYPGAYDDANAQRGPALPTVGAAFPPGCSDVSCVVPAPQCTNGCTPAPGTCTASSCTVGGQLVELAAYPRGCATNTCAMPISRCTGACTRAPGVFVNGTYSCPAQQPGVSVAAATTSATVDAEWNAPPSVTTQVAYEVPQPQATQVVVAAPPPQVDVAVDVASVLPWFFGAVLAAPVVAPMPAPAPVYGPAPGPVHGAVPVGSVRGRR